MKKGLYKILNEISENGSQTTFTKEQEEEFLKDAIVVFEYLKAGIDIKPSEIIINNGEIPFSCLEKILPVFSEKRLNNDNKTYTFHVYKSDEGKLVNIYEFKDYDNKDLLENSKIFIERKLLSMKRNILFIESSSDKRDSITKPQLEKIIDYALKNDVILLYDASSSNDFKGSENVKSIYELENAKKVAMEFRRFSSLTHNDKITCGYMVVPECLIIPKEGYKGYNLFKIKDLLQEEMKKGNVSRKSLKKSFLYYSGL